MNCVKISEAEYPLMEYIWEHAPISASALAAYSLDAFHWKKNTTYTVIKRLTLRGALERQEPGFIVTRWLPNSRYSSLNWKICATASLPVLRRILSFRSFPESRSAKKNWLS